MEEKRVRVLEDWPARSPDLNPLENLWGILARQVSDCGPTDVKELVKFVKKCWAEYPQAEIDKFVMSFQQRVVQCVANEGRRVKL